MGDEAIRITRSVAIPLSEIDLRYSRSSGPGGQHAQKVATRVEAVFDVAASPTLSDHQKARVIARTGPVLRAVAQDQRSQFRNRQLAIERLGEALRVALRVDRPRRATRPTRAAEERRLADKRRRAATKGHRRRPDDLRES